MAETNAETIEDAANNENHGHNSGTNSSDPSLHLTTNNANPQSEDFSVILDKTIPKTLPILKPEDVDEFFSSLSAGSVNLQTEDGRESEGTTVQNGNNEAPSDGQQLLSSSSTQLKLKSGGGRLVEVIKKDVDRWRLYKPDRKKRATGDKKEEEKASVRKENVKNYKKRNDEEMKSLERKYKELMQKLKDARTGIHEGVGTHNLRLEKIIGIAKRGKEIMMDLIGTHLTSEGGLAELVKHVSNNIGKFSHSHKKLIVEDLLREDTQLSNDAIDLDDISELKREMEEYDRQRQGLPEKTKEMSDDQLKKIKKERDRLTSLIYRRKGDLERKQLRNDVTLLLPREHRVQQAKQDVDKAFIYLDIGGDGLIVDLKDRIQQLRESYSPTKFHHNDIDHFLKEVKEFLESSNRV